MNEIVETIKPSDPDEKLHAMLAHLLGIIFGFVPSLIFWLINKDNPNRAFVTDQAKEALNFQINVAVAYVISMILIIIIIGIFMVMTLLIANLILCIMAGMAANQGQVYRYPSFIIRVIK